MKFAIMVYETNEDFGNRTDEAARESYWAAYSAYSKALSDAGVAAGGTALMPPDMATSLRMPGGKRHIQDGPFLEAKEQLGGMFLIDVPDLDVALQWAAKCPSASTGGVEVRPVLEMKKPETT
jgi:hypothetical protein